MHGKHRDNTLFSFHSPLTISLPDQVPKMKSKENCKFLLSTILLILFFELINILQCCSSAALPSPLINKVYPCTDFTLQQPKPENTYRQPSVQVENDIISLLVEPQVQDFKEVDCLKCWDLSVFFLSQKLSKSTIELFGCSALNKSANEIIALFFLWLICKSLHFVLIFEAWKFASQFRKQIRCYKSFFSYSACLRDGRPKWVTAALIPNRRKKVPGQKRMPWFPQLL